MSTFRDEGPLALEPRILLDAAALTTIEVTADLPDPATQVEERQQDQAQVDELVAALSAGSSRTVIFIDARVPDAEALLGPEVLEASDVFVIEATSMASRSSRTRSRATRGRCRTYTSSAMGKPASCGWVAPR